MFFRGQNGYNASANKRRKHRVTGNLQKSRLGAWIVKHPLKSYSNQLRQDEELPKQAKYRSGQRGKRSAYVAEKHRRPNQMHANNDSSNLDRTDHFFSGKNLFVGSPGVISRMIHAGWVCHNPLISQGYFGGGCVDPVEWRGVFSGRLPFLMFMDVELSSWSPHPFSHHPPPGWNQTSGS